MILSEEFARSWPGSHSRHIESQESVVDDPVEHDDIEEVVEPADPNPESKEMAKVVFPFCARCATNRGQIHCFCLGWTSFPFATQRLYTSYNLLRVGESKLQTTEKSPNNCCACSTKSLSRVLQRTRWQMVITRRQQKLRRQIVSQLRLRFHRLKLGLYSCFVFFMCNTLLRLRLKSFLTPTSLSSEESVEKAPDHKLASKPAKTRLEPKETPKEQPPEAGFVFV